MSMEKTPGIVLSLIPFRESSSIAALLTRNLGRLSAIAKGVRRTPTAPLTLERGQLAEFVLYVKPHRDLHTMGQISVINYFPSVRADLGKLALRDATLELILKSVTAPETHTELFDFAAAFLERLEAAPADPLPIHELWRFFYGWALHLGFMLDIRTCLRCGSDRPVHDGGLFMAERGGLICPACAGNIVASPSFIPGSITALLVDEGASADPAVQLSPAHRMRITRMLADYCRLHLDLRSGLTALDFLETVFFR
jgi:DNA repair protein RecO (recombination protein O)